MKNRFITFKKKTIMKKLLYLFVFILPLGLLGQSYDDASKASEICLAIQENSFMNDKKAEAALNKVLSVIGASKRFILQPCGNINNAVATSYKGLRYILYDKKFMNTIANKGNAWAQLFVLAHEVGHHINGHSIDILLAANDIVKPKTLAAKRQQELESDEFAGFILGRLGSSLEQASETINLIASDKDDTYSTHPNKTKRLAAIRKGYNNALGSKPSVYTNTTKAETGDEYFYRALEKNNNKDYYGALADYNKLIEMFPNEGFATYYNRGNVKNKLKDFDGAIIDYTKAIEINPNHADSYSNRGFVKTTIKDYYGSIADYNKAIELDPNDASFYYKRGGVKYDLKDYYGAIADNNKAIELKPNYAEAYLNRGRVKESLKDYYGAIADYNKAIEIDPNYAAAYANRAKVKYNLKDYYGGIADSTKAIELDPNYVDAYSGRGVIKYELKDYYGSIADFNKAIELDPNDEMAYRGRGIAKHNLKDYYGAIADCTKAIQLKPNFAQAYFSRGLAKGYLGDYNGACKDARKSQELGNYKALELVNVACK
mgnify:CR=1 FL=1